MYNYTDASEVGNLDCACHTDVFKVGIYVVYNLPVFSRHLKCADILDASSRKRGTFIAVIKHRT